MLLDVVIERNARRALDDVAGERRRVIGVRRVRPRRTHATGNVRREPASERDHFCRVIRDQIAAILLEPRRVGHDVPEGDRLRVRRGNLEVDVAIDVGVEIELPLLDELHYGRPGEELTRRADAKECALGIDRSTVGHIGVAITIGIEERAVLDDGDGRAGDMFVAQIGSHDSVEERRELAAIANSPR